MLVRPEGERFLGTRVDRGHKGLKVPRKSQETVGLGTRCWCTAEDATVVGDSAMPPPFLPFREQPATCSALHLH